jgi:methylmalonyl-CoA/ethylmalonyl-CoA epimerase
MPKKLEHIGIAVSNLEASEKLFTKLLGVAPYKRELVESEMVMTSFFLLGDVKFELLAATSPESTIAKFIEKKGEGLHHLAFESENIVVELAEKETQNFQLIHQTPKDGADNKTIAFLHPKTNCVVLN